MLRSIGTMSVSGALKAKLEAIADAGFEGVEVFEDDLLACPFPVEQVGAIIRGLGLVCTAFQPLRSFEGMPRARRAHALARAERRFELAEQLGAELLIVTANESADSLGERELLSEDLRELAERAAQRGLRVGYEPVPWARHIRDPLAAWSLVGAVDHPALGMVLDAFHWCAYQQPLAALDEIPSGKIFHVQLADAVLTPRDPQWLSTHRRVLPGQGELPLVEFTAALASDGYDGTLSLSIYNDLYRLADATDVALSGMRSLTWLLERVAEVRGVEGTGTPPRVVCHNVEFIEFCASETEAPDLEQMLRTLGFALVGRHKRKAVRRWRQGDCNLVINCDPQGFARQFHDAHGASVCAIGLRVDEPAQASARAAHYQVPTFSQAVAPGEYEIPAIKAVGGTLLYLVAARDVAGVWDTEFVPLGHPSTLGAGLRWVDHFTQTVPLEQMQNWALYYQALFPSEASRLAEVPDPVGLTYVQYLQATAGRLSLVLNGASEAQTLASRFLHSFGGAGVQQIAFATDDIFATAERLRALNMEFVSIPKNYYAELAADFSLDESLVERMAALNVLYDRDEHGEYFQLLCRAFAKRFFFEIVERRGYRGYGARNTATRIAAQSRYRNLVASTKTAVPLGG